MEIFTGYCAHSLLFKVSVMFQCLIIWFLIFNIDCLKIKIESLALTKSIKKSEADKLISYLINNGPYNLLAELISFQTIDFKKIATDKCFSMSISNILDIIQVYDNGNLAFDHYKTILSGDCASKWGFSVLNELEQLQLYDRLPYNFLESKDFNVNRMHPNIFLTFLNRAFNSEDREKIVWNLWTSKLGFKESKSFYNHRLWESTNEDLWQTINFINFANIKDENFMGRVFLAKFIGLKDEKLENYGLKELIPRFYTLLSFIKLWEIDHTKAVISFNGDYDHLNNVMLKNSVREIVNLLVNIHNRIRTLDRTSFIRLEDLLTLTLVNNENTRLENENENVNEFFKNFIKDSENVKIGDWLIGIFCILNDKIDSISDENLLLFMRTFFNLRPSIDSVIFIFKLLKEKRIDENSIDYLFYKFLKDKPSYYIEFYKSNSHIMPKNLVRLVPLNIRCIKNLKNRYGIPRILEFNSLINPNENNLQKFMEMVHVIGWTKLNINIVLLYKIFDFGDDDFEGISIEKVIKIYFELFLEQEEFYEILNYDEFSRPIIRILPVFPSDLWNQFAHLLTRAVLFKVEVPFMIDFEFFSELFEQDYLSTFLIEFSERIEESADDNLKEIYEFLNENVNLTPINLKDNLKELYSKLLSYRQSRSEYESEIKFYNNNIDSKLGITVILLSNGFKSFIKGLKNGFNLDDFSIEEVYKLIFYHK